MHESPWISGIARRSLSLSIGDLVKASVWRRKADYYNLNRYISDLAPALCLWARCCCCWIRSDCRWTMAADSIDGDDVTWGWLSNVITSVGWANVTSDNSFRLLLRSPEGDSSSWWGRLLPRSHIAVPPGRLRMEGTLKPESNALALADSLALALQLPASVPALVLSIMYGSMQPCLAIMMCRMRTVRKSLSIPAILTAFIQTATSPSTSFKAGKLLRRPSFLAISRRRTWLNLILALGFVLYSKVRKKNGPAFRKHPFVGVIPPALFAPEVVFTKKKSPLLSSPSFFCSASLHCLEMCREGLGRSLYLSPSYSLPTILYSFCLGDRMILTIEKEWYNLNQLYIREEECLQKVRKRKPSNWL